MSGLNNVGDLLALFGERLGLRWVAGEMGRDRPLKGDFPGANSQSLVGSLNCIHPNRIQVLGQAELIYLTDLQQPSHLEMVDRLYAAQPAAVIVTDNLDPERTLCERADRYRIPLLGSRLNDTELLPLLHYYLSRALAERITVHGVFMEVLGMGVLLTGEPAVGKSELALALISRGHRLVADDVPEFSLVAPDSLSGTCPAVLRDFLEVRGLGILNVRAMFGDSAVRQRKDLHLIIRLVSMDTVQLAGMDRLQGSHALRTLLGLPIPEVTMPVAPGRNMSVLVEAAVRDQGLRLRGYNAVEDFIERQRRLIDSQTPAEIT